MRLIFKIILVNLFVFSFLNSQTLIIEEINTESYPELKAKISLLDENNKVVHPILEQDIVVFDEVDKALTDFNCNKIDQYDSYSNLISVDLSSSIVEDSKLNSLKASLKNWNDNLLSNESVCIHGFSEEAILLQNFTANKTLLQNAIENLLPVEGTNYNNAFFSPERGILDLTNNIDGKGNVVFITDGNGLKKNFNTGDIIEKFNASSVSFYSLCIDFDTPQELKDIATSTGGNYFEVSSNPDEISKYLEIIKEFTYNKSTCEFKWISESCDTERNINISLDSYSIDSNITVQTRLNDAPRLKFLDVYLLDFKCFVRGEEEIRITAENGPVTISSIEELNSAEGVRYEVLDKSLPYTLDTNEILTLRVSYNPPPNRRYQVSGYEIVNSSCENYDFYSIVNCNTGIGEVNPITMSSPNGGETILAGTERDIEWKNNFDGSRKRIYYSTNNGDSWNFIREVINGDTYKWKVPEVESEQCLTRIIQYNEVYEPEKLPYLNTDSIDVVVSDWHPDNMRIAAGCIDGNIYVYNTNTRNLLYILSNQSSLEILDLQWSKDGKYLVSTDTDGTYIWEVENQTIINQFDTTFSLDIFDENILFGDQLANNIKFLIPPTTTFTDSIVYFENYKINQQFLYGVDNRSISLVPSSDAKDFQNLKTFEDTKLNPGFYYDLCMSSDYQFIMLAKQDTTDQNNKKYYLTAFDLNKGEFVDEIELKHKIKDIEFNRSNNLLVTVNDSADVDLWNIFYRDGEINFLNTETFTLDAVKHNHIDWSNDYSRFAVSSSDTNSIEKLNLFAVKSFPDGDDNSDSTFTIFINEFEVSDVEFGDIFVGNSKDSLVKEIIKFDPNYTLILDSFRLYGRNQNDFGVSFNKSFPIELGNGNDIELNISFSPSDFGERYAFIRLFAKERSFLVRLSGYGILPVIEKFDYEFGILATGQDSTMNQIALENNSEFEATVINTQFINPNNNFQLIDNIDGITINSNSTYYMSAEFISNSPIVDQAILKVDLDLEQMDTISRFIYLNAVVEEPSFSSIDSTNFTQEICNENISEIVRIKNDGRTFHNLVELRTKNNLINTNPLNFDGTLKENDTLTIEISHSFTNEKIVRDTLILELTNAELIEIPVELNYLESGLSAFNSDNLNYRVNTSYSFSDIIYLENTGDLPLYWDLPLVSNGGSIEITDIKNPLLPGEIDTVTFNFSGSDVQEIITLNLNPNNYCGEDLLLSIDINNRNPVFSSNTEELEIYTNCNEAKTDTFKFQNTGDTVLVLRNLFIDGADNDNFEIIDYSDTTKKGEFGFILIRYIPDRFSIDFASLNFSTNETDSRTRYLKLVGYNTNLNLEYSESELVFTIEDGSIVNNERLSIKNNDNIPYQFSYSDSELNNLLTIESINPIVILPGETEEVIFRYIGPVKDTSNIMVYLDKSCESDEILNLSVNSYIYKVLNFELEELRVNIGDTFEYSTSINNADILDSLNINSFTVYYHLNKSVLSSVDREIVYDNGLYLVPVEYQLNEIFESDKNITFKALWGNDSCSTIAIHKIETDNANVRLDFNSSIGSVCIEDLCEEGGLRLFDNQKIENLVNINPNPVSESLNIDINIIEKGHFELSIYNQNGQKIMSLENKFMNPGSYKRNYDISKIPSGIYYIEYKSILLSRIKKVIVIN